MESYIYDVVVILVFILSGGVFFFAAYRKLPADAQKVFDSVLPWSSWVPVSLGVSFVLLAVSKAYELLF